MTEKLWEPSEELVSTCSMTRFMRWLELGHETYEELWQWSVDDLEAFWHAIWRYYDIASDAVPERVLGSRDMPGAEWFPGVQLNYAEHVFRAKDDDQPAIFFEGESTEPGMWTYAELRAQTARVRAGLVERGVVAGDRVVAYLPNIPETIAAFLATASLGAYWSSCSPDFGAQSVTDRFEQIEPKVLLATSTYNYGGKEFDRSEVVEQLRADIPSLEHTVMIEDWFPESDEPLEFERVPFDHPLWILYSSGTTGLPKAIVQGHGGILLEQLKKMHLHVNAQEGDRVFWFTTTGWMMWNFLVGVLLTPAAIVTFDGNPGYPDMGRLWDLAERTEVTTFGTGAAYIHGCMKAEVHPAEGRELKVNAVGATGSPLSPEGFQWVYDELGKDVWLFSTSGGTDVCTAFVGGVPIEPVYLGELQGRSLGCDVHAFDEDGNSVIEEVGELVITQPMPSMPLYLWGDEDGSRLHESYFDMYPGVWRHGDWIKITERGTAVISGRSDSTINRGGIRMGTAEIYRAALAVDSVTDALVVDVDDWMPLFVVVDGELTDDVVKEIKTRIREDCSPRHVPSEIFKVDAVPRTLSGKVLEVPVKKVFQGADPDKAASRESLANPEAYDWFVDFARERSESSASTDASARS
ncbi:MAG: acetoacetyl-CoA synthetase [Solirubrobacteraceae bacterium]|nr:acetoacetyl-CoA synthetase [Solirubrobacteraceae bacterium]